MRVGEGNGADALDAHQRHEPREHRRQIALGRRRRAAETPRDRTAGNGAGLERDRGHRALRGSRAEVVLEQRQERARRVHRRGQRERARVMAAARERQA